jgi:hypothetical protein
VASSAEALRPLALQLNAGHAIELKGGTTLDFGAVYARYSRYSGLRAGKSYAEAYAGISGKLLSSRIYFSPDYFGGGPSSYAELDGHLPIGEDLSVQGHGGVFVPFSAYSRGSSSVRRYDWSIGLSRTAGRFVFQANVSAGGPREAYYGDYSRGHALALGVRCAL